mmetsp:Transcript_15789/g.31758  ORF Transcript_15789/g.31758 Transcript_15789/m.31758 type:complete len:356 (-) Transcript_15789:211-1278(-)
MPDMEGQQPEMEGLAMEGQHPNKTPIEPERRRISQTTLRVLVLGGVLLVCAAVVVPVAIVFTRSNDSLQVVPTSTCISSSDMLLSLRRKSIACLAVYEDATSYFGTRDGPYAEYEPTRLQLEGTPLLAAEPLNSVSSLAFDEVACDPVAQSFGLDTAASMLAIGSFAMHAAGEGGTSLLTQKMDVVPMACVVTGLVHAVMNRTGTPDGVYGVYVSSLGRSCGATLSNIMDRCAFDGSMAAELDQLDSELLSFGDGFSLLVLGLAIKCLGEAGANALLSGFFPGSGGSQLAANFSLVGPTLSLAHPACAKAFTGMNSAIEAASYQGEIEGSVDQHDQWHKLMARAFSELLEGIDAL